MDAKVQQLVQSIQSKGVNLGTVDASLSDRIGKVRAHVEANIERLPRGSFNGGKAAVDAELKKAADAAGTTVDDLVRAWVRSIRIKL